MFDDPPTHDLGSDFVLRTPSGHNAALPVTAARDGPNNLFGPFGFLKAGQVRNGVQFLIKGAGRNILFPRCSWVSVLEVLGCFLKDLGRVLRHLGPILDDLWPALEDLGLVLEDLDTILEDLGPVPKDLVLVFGDLYPVLENLDHVLEDKC